MGNKWEKENMWKHVSCVKSPTETSWNHNWVVRLQSKASSTPRKVISEESERWISGVFWCFFSLNHWGDDSNNRMLFTSFYLDHWSWGWSSKMFIGSHSITKLYWITQFGSISSVLSVYPLSGIVAWHKQNEEPSTDPQNGDTTLLPTSS